MTEVEIPSHIHAGYKVRVTHCKYGHEYTPENTHWDNKGRKCRQCRRDANERRNPNRRRPPQPISERIANSIEVNASGCWIWQRSLVNTGYGTLVVTVARGRKRTQLAHRASYEAFVGPIPEGLHIDHLCRVRACVNPDHLEAVTQAENNRRARAHKEAKNV